MSAATTLSIPTTRAAAGAAAVSPMARRRRSCISRSEHVGVATRQWSGLRRGACRSADAETSTRSTAAHRAAATRVTDDGQVQLRTLADYDTAFGLDTELGDGRVA